MSNFSFTPNSNQSSYPPYLQPIPSLGTSGRTSASVAVGSSRAGAGSSSRVAAWQRQNPPLPGSTPYEPNNSNGGYGGGGGGGAPQFKANGAGNGYSGGNGGNGLVCIWANINDTNTTGNISAIPASPQPTIPAPSPIPNAILNVTSASTNNISYTNSAYPNNTIGGNLEVQSNGATYYSIFMGPGTYTITTNLSIINLAMCGAGGGGAGGAALENDNCVLGAGGGGGGGVISGTIYLYSVNGNNFGLTSTIQVTVGYGGSGGAGGYKNPGSGQNYVGFGGSNGGETTVTITQSGPYAQFTAPLTMTCTGGGGGNAAPGNTGSANNNTVYGGTCGSSSTSGFSQNGTNLLPIVASGGNGGYGSSINTLNYSIPITGSNVTNNNSNFPYQVFAIPAANSTIPYPGSSATYTGSYSINVAAINMGGGGGGSNGNISFGSDNNSLYNILGGQGSGGSGGAINSYYYKTPSSVAMDVFNVIGTAVLGALIVDAPSAFISLIFA
jgi:hypothetical protein